MNVPLLTRHELYKIIWEKPIGEIVEQKTKNRTKTHEKVNIFSNFQFNIYVLSDCIFLCD